MSSSIVHPVRISNTALKTTARLPFEHPCQGQSTPETPSGSLRFLGGFGRGRLRLLTIPFQGLRLFHDFSGPAPGPTIHFNRSAAKASRQQTLHLQIFCSQSFLCRQAEFSITTPLGQSLTQACKSHSPFDFSHAKQAASPLRLHQAGFLSSRASRPCTLSSQLTLLSLACLKKAKICGQIANA